MTGKPNLAPSPTSEGSASASGFPGYGEDAGLDLSSGVSDGLCKRGVSHLKEIDYGYDQAEEERRARAGA